MPAENAAVTINNIGAKDISTTWASEVLCILWHVRWAAKGLMPVKPAVYTRYTLSISPGQACCCNQASST